MITDKNIATAVNIYLKSYELVLNQFQDPTFAVQTATAVTMILMKEENSQTMQQNNPLLVLSTLLQNAKAENKKPDVKPDKKKPDQAADQKDGETHD
ncbi:hypothetical protein [Faecalibacterium prausnitzii]|uniref:hypothetical protein n=1 Tax=Faecalibacterium prausnitzii TaxID=853 RepID=UPI003C300AC1